MVGIVAVDSGFVVGVGAAGELAIAVLHVHHHAAVGVGDGGGVGSQIVAEAGGVARRVAGSGNTSVGVVGGGRRSEAASVHVVLEEVGQCASVVVINGWRDDAGVKDAGQVARRAVLVVVVLVVRLDQ